MQDHQQPSTNGNNMESAFDYDHNPTWRIFRIMAEFVDGFTFLSRIQKTVTFFGSARLPETDRFYTLAHDVAARLAQAGYTIVTGGGPGIMQAANQGAWDVGGESVGLNIQLPNEQRINRYVKQSLSFNFFFSRKVILDFSAEAFIFFPGGFGTLDEFSELITLVQTGKHERTVPIILMGRTFWQPLTDWMETQMLRELGTINKSDLKIWTITDDIDEAVKLVEAGMQQTTIADAPEKPRRRRTPEGPLHKATRPMMPTEQ